MIPHYIIQIMYSCMILPSRTTLLKSSQVLIHNAANMLLVLILNTFQVVVRHPTNLGVVGLTLACRSACGGSAELQMLREVCTDSVN